MNPRSLILIALAGVGVLLVVMLTRNYLTGLQQQNQQAQVATKEVVTARVLVAAKTLPVGRLVTAEDFKWQPWPQEGVSSAYLSAPNDKMDTLVGKVVRAPLVEGDPITRASLVALGEKGFMAAVLTPGMRAVTVKLSPTSSIGGFVFPGDRVDVILTQSFAVEGAKIPYVVSETVFQNVRVLGVDQRGPADIDKVQIAKTATLEVTPKMAEKVAMLEKLGSLSLSLRSLAAGNDGLPSDPNSPPVSVTLSYTGAPEVSKFRPDMDQEDNVSSIVVKRGSSTNVVPLDGGSKEPGK